RRAGHGAQHRPATRRTRASRPRGGRVSRHARRGTQGEQDWGSGEYPDDSETDLGPGADYPSQPDPGGGHSDAYRWAPDPLAGAPRGHGPVTGPQAPDRWAPSGPEQPWP